MMDDFDQFERNLAAALRADAELSLARFEPGMIASAAVASAQRRSERIHRRFTVMPSAFWPIVLLAMLVLLAIAGAILSAGARQQKLSWPLGPARNGVIVIGTADGDIVSVDPSASTTRTLFSGSPDDSLFVNDFSNDGRRFLFMLNGTWYVANADGSGSRELPQPQGSNYAWSPSGDRLVATAGDENGPTTISIIDVERMTSTRFDLGIDGHAIALWRPNHDQLVLTEEKRVGMAFYLVNADGSDLRPIEGMSPDPGNLLALSPDGSMLAYEVRDPGEGGTIHIADIDSGLDRRLDHGGVPYLGGWFSPAGTKLLLGRVAGSDTAELVIVPADGGGAPTPIGGLHRSMGGGSAWVDVVWSPDGRQILTTYYERYGSTGDGDAPTSWLLDVASGEARQMPWVARDGMTWQRLAASTPVPLPTGNPAALAAGTYRMGGGLGAPSVASLPALTLTVGDGWLGFNDSHSALEIYKEGIGSIWMMPFAEGEAVNMNADCGHGPYGPVTDVVFKSLPARSVTETATVPGPCGAGVSWDRSRSTGRTMRTTLVVKVDGGVVLIGTLRWVDADPAVQREIDEIIDSIRFDSPMPIRRASATPR